MKGKLCVTFETLITMKKYVFDFSVDAWLQNVEIEADNLDQAKEELFKKSLADLVEEGYVKDFSISEIDYEVEEEEE